ncbi:MAG: hypothetical protein CVU77_03600 [Elusimicrobia bacterium HGW-Elusimicrobia-1]|jgi:protein arginine kinase activator|nr:MAG: hypothetical protein CVU77_03600 [Elusimicrobia bacterium HGW-Elusimicrobia-1]
MLCQKCQKNEATVFIDAVVNGARWKYHVCARCASREVIVSSPARPAPARGVCHRCGTSRKRIASTSRFGCATCYELFGAEILDSPDQAGHEHLSSKDAGQPELSESADAAAVVKKLREKLSRAVRREDYEEAAAIRDEIKKRSI